MLLSIFFFILAGLAEIGGGYLVWLYMRDDKGPVYLLAGATSFDRYYPYPIQLQTASFLRVYQPRIKRILLLAPIPMRVESRTEWL